MFRTRQFLEVANLPYPATLGISPSVFLGQGDETPLIYIADISRREEREKGGEKERLDLRKAKKKR